ncbi:MgtC/SapB family protein [Geomobilimonas luticola]|uniref:MgtC/SapB family protein n=1 Tax=Geomobilimonas luticola TaxID=1114878 RepID=A0ABS5SFB6_9BACT|nr:MgtC/SapB family protein [Geomobilimonas luticola]MBT0654049.1 MgtC/SapB family protein [Geomobilimonas luticola]
MHFDFSLELLLRLVLACLFGGVIGLEREVHGRPAGFRTHLLVSLGACLFVLTSIQFYYQYGSLGSGGPSGVDPGRVAAQVVTGIGFLGAGAIIRDRASIRGLTTAACLWVAAALGVACGVGLYAMATVVTLIALMSLLLLKKVESRLQRDTYVSLKVWSNDLKGQQKKFEELIAANQMQVVTVNLEKDVDKQQATYEFYIKFSTRELASSLVDDLAAVAGVRKVRVE